MLSTFFKRQYYSDYSDGFGRFWKNKNNFLQRRIVYVSNRVPVIQNMAFQYSRRQVSFTSHESTQFCTAERWENTRTAPHRLLSEGVSVVNTEVEFVNICKPSQVTQKV